MAIQTFEEAYKDDNQPFSIRRSGGRRFVGFYADIRIDRDTVPEGWHVYDIRDDGGDSPFDELKNGYVVVNHAGTFATQEDIGLPEGETLYYSGKNELKEDEFSYSFE